VAGKRVHGCNVSEKVSDRGATNRNAKPAKILREGAKEKLYFALVENSFRDFALELILELIIR